MNVTDYGAKGDGKIVTDGAMTAAGAALTSSTAGFTSADVGKLISVAMASSFTGTGNTHSNTTIDGLSTSVVTALTVGAPLSGAGIQRAAPSSGS